MQSSTPWQLARRAERLEPSVIREILKVTERPGVISLAGGLPAPESFPVEAMREACQRVLTDTPREALQYAASEGYGPLRDWVAHDLKKQGMWFGVAVPVVEDRRELRGCRYQGQRGAKCGSEQARSHRG